MNLYLTPLLWKGWGMWVTAEGCARSTTLSKGWVSQKNTGRGKLHDTGL